MATKQLLQTTPVGSGVRATLPGGVLARPGYTSALAGGINTSFYGSSSAAGSFPVGTTDTQQSASIHATSGFVADYVGPGGAGAGTHYSRTYGGPAGWTAGQTYSQWAIVYDSSGVGSKTYTKFTAGSLPSTTAPSADAVNWRLVETPGTNAPAFFNGELIQTGLSLRGDEPARLQLLSDGIGDSATLLGRSADGTTSPDAQLRVNGVVECEFLRLRNIIHAANPTFGTNTIQAGQSFVQVPTTASDLNALIFVQAKTPPGAGGMIPYVTAQTATNFNVSAIDPATGAPGAVTANLDFCWWILNPVY